MFGRHVSRVSVVVTSLLVLGACSEAGPTETLEGELAQVVEIAVDSRDHVDGDVAYSTSPPAGGDHFGTWQNCGVYIEPLRDEVAVHSLEHGAVWITFPPTIDQANFDAVLDRALGESHFLVSPYPGQASPLVLTAWGRQLSVDSFDDPAVEAFIEQYRGRDSPTAPEPGASCSGGIGVAPDDPMAGFEGAGEAMESGG